MALVDYSLERFPEELTDQIGNIDAACELEFGELDPQAEEQAHRTNLMISEWIEQLATSTSSSHSRFMPDHTYVALHYLDLVDRVQTEKFEVGFFRLPRTQNSLVPPAPSLTLYSWRVTELGFGIIWTSLGFRCQEISAEAEEAVYQQVLRVASRSV